MHWLYTTFKTHCETKNILLLKEDMRYIERCLFKIPEEARKRVMKGFIEEWSKGMGACEKVDQKQNMGRRMANLWLRGMTS